MKQFKQIGFFISMGLLLLYVISASQLFDVQYATTNQGVALFSPLSYTEEMFQLLINNQAGWGIIFAILLLFAIALGTFNAVLYREAKE